MEIYRATGAMPLATLMAVERIAREHARDHLISRRCERDVVISYRELRSRGQAESRAFQACTTLYRSHHPEASIDEARKLVTSWIDHHVVRGHQGATPGCACEDSQRG